MTVFVLAFAVILFLSLAVVALVALQARRDGREVLTPHGEQLVQTARDRTSDIASAARARAGGARTTGDRPDGQEADRRDISGDDMDGADIDGDNIDVDGDDEVDLRDRDDVRA